MKSFLSLCVVLAVAALASGSELEDPSSAVNSDYQQVAPLRLLFRTVLKKPAVRNQIQREQVVFRGDGRTVIRRITHNPVGQVTAGVRVTSGGVRYTHATLQIESVRGLGYHIIVEMFG